MMRRTAWLVWLCMALLPVRGMAHTTMMFAGAPASTSARMVADAPCPMHVAAPTAGDAVHDGSTDDGTAGTHAAGCQLCALCHSAAMPPLQIGDFAATAPSLAPQARSGLGAGLDGPDGLFRPPRL